MKKIASLLIAISSVVFSFAQTVFWTENFNNGCTSLCVANTYSGINGAWTVTNSGAANACGAPTTPNEWYVSCAENGNAVGTCGTGCGSDATLHVGNIPSSPSAGIFCPPGDCGAAYDAGGYCNLLATPPSTETDKRAESPTINCTGQSNITISFKYLENGQGANDDATLWYYDGTSWSQIDPIAKSNNAGCAGGQGRWTAFSMPLPASANNNPNVKIGFRWVNDDDGSGSDPSFAVDEVQLSVPGGAPPVASFSVTTTICAGQCVNFTDLSTGSPTGWSWSFPGATPNSSITQSPTNICYSSSGTYTATLTATNGNGSSNSSQVITVNPLPIANAGMDVTICPGATATLTASGGGNYLWNTNATTASITVNPTTTTSYSVIVSTSCGSGTDSVSVVVSNNITASVSGNTTICTGQGTTLTATGGSNYSWSDGSTAALIMLTPTTTTTYSVIVSSGTCADTISVTVNITSPPTASATSTNVCYGFTDTLFAFGGGNYLWSNGATTSSIIVTNTTTTFYSVIVSLGSCSDTANATFSISPVQNMNAGSNVTITQGESITLTASGATEFMWSTGDNSISIIVSPNATTTYCVTGDDILFGTCYDTACVTVTVEPLDCSAAGELFIPNAFSPNGDLENDVLQAYYGNALCIKSLSIKIFDRWGEKVFESDKIAFGWDGIFNGKKLNTEVYTYYLKAELEGGKTIDKKGNISLVR